MSGEQYSYVEKLELIHALSVELRALDITEEQFRARVGGLGFNATDIDHYFKEAMRPPA